MTSEENQWHLRRTVTAKKNQSVYEEQWRLWMICDVCEWSECLWRTVMFEKNNGVCKELKILEKNNGACKESVMFEKNSDHWEEWLPLRRIDDAWEE